ncbi:Glutaredoxin-C6 [Hibiscus syriacus]|uniref:Glutaredoxin-C6 n=1 Tax=Hibiscus syriacus TaxID=106335 RepID=A0A6A3A5A7_HIBSY|nr:glutaredoxin-C6-like [Hibiscus syriacus]KAE8698425.1 Glutaredoxin-C6 [Hibiscus syriacus]
MQSLSCSSDVVQLDLTSLPPPSSSSSNSTPMSATTTTTTAISGCLSIDEDEPTETRLRRMISEHPVIIFGQSSCCMCHVMKKLLATIGVHPTVIELDEREMAYLPPPPSPAQYSVSPRIPSPAVFIGGTGIGGLESLMALHLSGHLVPKLVEVGSFWV